MEHRKYWQDVVRRAPVLGVLALVVACSGAAEQDVLSKQIGSSAASGGTSGQTTSGSASGDTSGGTSGQTTSGSASGGTTSGSPDGCVEEKDDSTEKDQLAITSCARGAFHFPDDQEDWLRFERPKGAKFSAKWSGPLDVRFWDDRGRSYDIEHLPGREGSYSVQIQYDFKNNPLSGEELKKPLVFEWTFEVSFN